MGELLRGTMASGSQMCVAPQGEKYANYKNTLSWMNSSPLELLIRLLIVTVQVSRNLYPQLQEDVSEWL
jgi:hypothetical protein